MYVQGRREKVVYNQTFVLFVYGAYNAMGLIGTECNGIAVLNKTLLQVVLDEHTRCTANMGEASNHQLEELDRIAALEPAEFSRFCTTHPRYRPGSFISARLPSLGDAMRLFTADEFTATSSTGAIDNAD
jgi:hypothetical protein